jgi:ABC-type branched-subunit amino acid transport system substrate-binding protein
MQNPSRRSLVRATLGLAGLGSLPAWAQTSAPNTATRPATLAQIVDTSLGQIDVSKNFLTGARAAWQDINAKGGLRGKPVKHLVLEVDGSLPSLRTALDALKNESQCLALFGTAGERAAVALASSLTREMPELAHVAPWLQNPATDAGSTTFPIFASRDDQISHAVRSLSVMGVTELGAVYSTAAEKNAYQLSLEKVATALKMRLRSYSPATDLQQLGKTLAQDSPRILIFLGGTPELVQFTQGLDKQTTQRYVVAMADVNLQTVLQLASTRQAPVIATQVVPLVNSSIPIVRAYREILGRLYDEPPTPQSLAGFISARYTFETLLGIDGPVNRSTALQAFQRRSAIDLGGFQINLDAKTYSGTYVTQSMISTDGRLLG